MTIYQIILFTIFIISEIIILINAYFEIRKGLLDNKKITFSYLISNFFIFLLPMVSTIYSFLIISDWINKIDLNLNKNQKITQIIFNLPKKSEIYEGQVFLSEDKQGYISIKE